MGGQGMPEGIKRIVSLGFTVIAALLYAGLLGYAIVCTLTGADTQFSANMVRAAGLLSGLVGSVVTAGFARSEPGGSAQLDREGPSAGRPPGEWRPLEALPLWRRNLASLASTLGLGGEVRAPRSGAGEGSAPDKVGTPVWVALLYFAVYFLVGVGAFLTGLLRSGAPEIVANAGWVWLGTAISSAYSFLGLNARR